MNIKNDNRKNNIVENDAPFISIIITCYNYEKYVRECIESALAQDYRNYEILVVDDGSTDNSLDVISAYKDKVEVISTPNQGSKKACLLGFSRSRGTHVLFLDADDTIRPSMLSRSAEYLKLRDVSKVQVLMQPIDADGKEVRQPFPRLSGSITPNYFRDLAASQGCYPTPPTSGNIYRRDVYDNVGDISYDYGIDGVAYLFAAFCGRVIHLPEILANYRVHGNNASSQTGLSATGFRKNADTFIQRMHHLKELVGLHTSAHADFPVSGNYQYVIEALSYSDTMSGKTFSPGRAVAFFRCRAGVIPSKRDVSMAVLILALSILPRSMAQKLVAKRYGR